MMKMDDRNSAEYQIWEKRNINVILEKLKSLKDKRCIVLVFFIKPKEEKTWEAEIGDPIAIFERFLLERETSL